jgi:heme/copper-type cytochrome/quinol oxidase subunit 2
MDAILDFYYWVKLALLAAVVVLAIVGALRASGDRVLVPWRAGLNGALALGVFIAAAMLATSGLSLVWALILIVLGAAAGYAPARRARTRAAQGRTVVHRSPLAPWVWAAATILVAVTLLFGTSYLYGLALLVMAFAAGLVIGQIAGELAAVRRQAEAAAGAVAEPAL